MQSAPLLKICAVNATGGINGYPFSLALIKKAMDSASALDVCSLLFLHLRKDLPATINDNSKFSAVECLDVGSLNELRLLLNQKNLSRNSLVFIDSLSALIDQFSLPSTSWFLTQIAEMFTCVLALMHNLDGDDWHRIESIASSVFELKPSNDGVATLCKTIMKKKNGTSEGKVDQYTISDDYTFELRPFVERDSVEQMLASSFSSAQQNNEKFELGKLPFDIGLNLSEKERREKASVQLPFMAAQTQKGLVALNISAGKKCRAGGQILYMPDKEDDFDESDPDDDLTI